jgi:hypothetical protein
MRQKFGDAVDGVIGNAGEDVFEPGEGLDVHTLTRGYEAAQHGSCPTAAIAAKEHPVAATHRHHASILRISGRKLRFVIVGTRFTADDCGCSTANNVRAAGLSMSKWRPAL